MVRTQDSRCVAHGNIELIDLWEHHLETLKVLYNTFVLLSTTSLAQPLQITRAGANEIRRPSWLTEEFCGKQRQQLLELDPDHYFSKGFRNESKTKVECY